MKQPKKLTLRQKKILKGKRMNPENWMLVKEGVDYLQVVNKASGRVREIGI